MRKPEGAGLHTKTFNSPKRHMIALQKSNTRKYKQDSEKSREIAASSIVKKDYSFYSKEDPHLWNESSKLSQKHSKYSHLNNDPAKTFKKTVRNIKDIQRQEKEDRLNQHLYSVVKSKQDVQEAYALRRLERMVQ